MYYQTNNLYNNWIAHWPVTLKKTRFHGGQVAIPKTMTRALPLMLVL